MHYGDISLTFLSNLQRADDEGHGLSYVSAVAIEEKSVWDYNQGNPSGDPLTLGDHGKPSVPLVAIYPKEGTLISDHPWVVLEAPWVTDAKKQAAQLFVDYVQAPEQQQRFQKYAFRNFEGQPGSNITPANGLLPSQPKAVLPAPSPIVIDGILKSWKDLRKRARVLIVMDVSGSMDDPSGVGGLSKLELSKQAAIDALSQFAPDDDVGLWEFSSDLPGGNDYQELVPIGPLGEQGGRLESAIRGLSPVAGTPLYTAVGAAAEAMRSGFDPDRINGIVLLTDGVNDDENDDLDGLLRELDSEIPVRVFAIAYGADADLATLTKIANASQGAVYDASDPTTISKVFVSVISNF